MENWNENSQEVYNEELDSTNTEYYPNAWDYPNYRELTKFGESPIPISTVIWDPYYEALWTAYQNVLNATSSTHFVGSTNRLHTKLQFVF